MKSTVVCTATHPVDLDDGRSLPPGETADDVDLNIESNAELLKAGQLYEVGDKKPDTGSGQHDKENDKGGNN